jgi:Rv0078B-related antitoxin
MEPIRDPEVRRRARDTFDLFETAENIMRQNLRRRHPEASEDEIKRLLLSWLRKEDDPDPLPPGTRWVSR